MYANKHSTYKSSYNTEIVASLKKVEIANGNPMLKPIAAQPTSINFVTASSGKARNSAFDFAGLAG
jgi:hypothetical protein